MKKLLFFLFIPLISFSQVSYDDIMPINSISLTDSLDIMKVMKFQENAWNSGNINSFMQRYIKSDAASSVSTYATHVGPSQGRLKDHRKFGVGGIRLIQPKIRCE